MEAGGMGAILALIVEFSQILHDKFSITYIRLFIHAQITLKWAFKFNRFQIEVWGIVKLWNCEWKSISISILMCCSSGVCVCVRVCLCAALCHMKFKFVFIVSSKSSAIYSILANSINWRMCLISFGSCRSIWECYYNRNVCNLTETWKGIVKI